LVPRIKGSPYRNPAAANGEVPCCFPPSSQYTFRSSVDDGTDDLRLRRR
jgi:hypothetical protein